VKKREGLNVIYCSNEAWRYRMHDYHPKTGKNMRIL
jgi:hypothetical protein